MVNVFSKKATILGMVFDMVVKVKANIKFLNHFEMHLPPPVLPDFLMLDNLVDKTPNSWTKWGPPGKYKVRLYTAG